MKKNILIIGGSSGVGRKLAEHYVAEGHTVCVTGRHNPDISGVKYIELHITNDPDRLATDMDWVLADFDSVNTLVYAAGYLQRGHIEDFSDQDLKTMINVGLLAPMMFIRRLKSNPGSPLKIMLITSSSQYTPREFEPVYCATKSGLGMLGASLVRDPEIGKVLVVAPSGIRTGFWNGTDENTETMLDPGWVSAQIVEQSGGAFKYKYVRILRNPARTEVVECLDNQFNPI